MKANPNDFTPSQIDAMLGALDEQNEKAAGLGDKIKKIDKDVDDKIAELQDLVDSSKARKGVADKIK